MKGRQLRSARWTWARPWRWRGPRWPVLLAVSLALALGLGLIVGSTVLGIVEGMRETAQMRQKSAQFHYQQGLLYLRAGQRELALAEFQEALRLNPRHLEAQRQVLALLLPTPTPAPTPTPRPTATVNPDAFLLAILNAAQEDMAAGRWQQAYGRLEQLQALAPDFHADEVTDLLYRAALNEGLDLLRENRMEEALRAFDRALRWKPDDKEARRQRDLAEAYILGVSYFYADWDSAIAIFEGLYRQAPDYKDVRDRYLEALRKGAEHHLKRGDPCQAIAYLDRLRTTDPTADVAQLREEAVQACAAQAEATPETK